MKIVNILILSEAIVILSEAKDLSNYSQKILRFTQDDIHNKSIRSKTDSATWLQLEIGI